MIRSEGKNIGRLKYVCAAHYRRFGEWPTYVRMQPIILWDLMISLGETQFQSLAGRLKLSTRKKWGLGVGSRRGFTDYDDASLAGVSADMADEWLGVRLYDWPDE